jgi:hypothetical protein
MNEVVSNKERKKETTPLNPKRPHKGEGVPTRNIGIPIPQTDDWKEIMGGYRQLAAQDDSSLAYVYREALIEYHENHMPGNPGLPLTNFMPGGPGFSKAAKEKLGFVDRVPSVYVLPDFAAMSEADLLATYRKAVETHDEGTRQITRYHINRRGLKP